MTKALAAIRHSLARQKRGEQKPPVPEGVCFFDILVYLTPESLHTGRFGSQYWGALVHAAHEAEAPVQWIHVLYPHAEVPTLEAATTLLRRFNAASGTRAHHVLLEAAAGRRVWLKGTQDYLRLRRIERHVRAAATSFAPTWTAFRFWPLFKQSWQRSFRSPTVLRDCVRLAQFEALLSLWPPQRIGVFIQENQAWELALMYAWRQAGHGTLVGTPHTTVRFWDLRYFRDPRAWGDSAPGAFPVPDMVAVNGPMAATAFREAGYDTTQLKEVEALRFDHLLQYAARPDARTHASAEAPRRILVCGDNIPFSNERLLAAVGVAARLVSPDTTWVFKPHKARPCDPGPLAGMSIPVDDRPLAELLGECDLVVTGNTTSAAADAYFRGIGVAVLRDGAKLHGSPVRGLDDVGTFADGEGLAHIVAAPRGARQSGAALFTLDAKVPRWRSLFGWKRAS